MGVAELEELRARALGCVGLPVDTVVSEPLPTRHRLRVCHVFAGGGPLRAGGVASIAAAKGMVCDEWDTKQDPLRHDPL